MSIDGILLADLFVLIFDHSILDDGTLLDDSSLKSCVMLTARYRLLSVFADGPLLAVLCLPAGSARGKSLCRRAVLCRIGRGATVRLFAQ